MSDAFDPSQAVPTEAPYRTPPGGPSRLPRNNALDGLKAIAWILSLLGAVVLIIGLVMSNNEPNMYSSSPVDILSHSMAANATLAAGFSILGAAFTSWLIVMAVYAIVREFRP